MRSPRRHRRPIKDLRRQETADPADRAGAPVGAPVQHLHRAHAERRDARRLRLLVSAQVD